LLKLEVDQPRSMLICTALGWWMKFVSQPTNLKIRDHGYNRANSVTTVNIQLQPCRYGCNRECILCDVRTVQ
jgi:hypothetical protein